jgi:hypothetical protein
MLAPRRRHRSVHGRKPEQWRRNGCLLALWNLQGLKFSDDVLSCGLRAHLGIDIEDAPVGSDVEGPPGGEWAVRVDDAVRGRRFLVRVAQDGIVGLDVLGELLVRLGNASGPRRTPRAGAAAGICRAQPFPLSVARPVPDTRSHASDDLVAVRVAVATKGRRSAARALPRRPAHRADKTRREGRGRLGDPRAVRARVTGDDGGLQPRAKEGA